MIIKDGRLGSIRIRSTFHESDCYEVYKTYTNASLLVVHPVLYNRWLAEHLFFASNPFNVTNYNGSEYYYYLSDKTFSIVPVQLGNAFCNREQALTFAFALKQMRTVTDASLYDGIYIEEFGYILPTYTDEVLPDDIVIGNYITGGHPVRFSEENLITLYLNECVYDEISEITGIRKNKRTAYNTPPDGENKPKEFTLAGRKKLETFFNEHIINVLKEPKRYKKLGVDFPSSIILHGPPGCGKTYAVDRLVEYLGLPRFDINSSTVASPYIHDTAKKVASVFESAIAAAPSIVVIDEMESYLSDRDGVLTNGHHIEEVAEFLQQIQKAQSNKVLIIAMTNLYDKIDPAVLRRGRFDYHIEVGLPSVEEIYALLMSITKNIALSQDVSLSDLSKELLGKTLADVVFIIKEAGLISGKNGDDRITLAAITEAIDEIPKEQLKRRIGFGSD